MGCDLVGKLIETASVVRDAEERMLLSLGGGAYDAMCLSIAEAVAREAGMGPRSEMGCAASVKELHPGMFVDSLSDPLKREQVMLLTPAEKLAFAATGSYSGSSGTVPANLVQLFGYSDQVLHAPLSGFAFVLESVAGELGAQIRCAYRDDPEGSSEHV